MKGGLQEMRTVVELMYVMLRSTTDLNSPVEKQIYVGIYNDFIIIASYLEYGVLLVHYLCK